MLKRFRPDGYLADMPDSDIEDDVKEKVKKLNELNKELRKDFILD